MLDILYGHLTWPQVKQAIDEDYIVLLPVGTIEQHGPHLPVFTDDCFAQKWAYDAAILAREKYKVKTVVCPPIHYGDSLLMGNIPGTLTLRAETLKNVVFDVGSAVLEQGFRRLVIVNVHGGNRYAVNIAAREIKAKFYQEHRDIIVRVADDTNKDLLTRDFWQSAAHLDPEAANGYMVHAGSLETAKMLVIDPTLVHQDKYPRGITVERKEHVFFLDEVAVDGAMGDPSGANEEAGQLLWDELIGNLAAYLNRI